MSAWEEGNKGLEKREITYRSPYQRRRSRNVPQSNSHRPLLLGLGARAGDPRLRDGGAAPGADYEDEGREVAHGRVQSCSSKGEADGSERLERGQVPRALVEVARRESHAHRRDAGDQVWRAGHDEGFELAETWGF